MINWPTAFVIAVAMICGAVLMNKPSDAALVGNNVAVAITSSGTAVQVSGEKIRACLPSPAESDVSPYGEKIIHKWNKSFFSPWN